MKYGSQSEIMNTLMRDSAQARCSSDSVAQLLPEKRTPSEVAILREIAKGKTTKEIVFDKSLRFHTANTRRKNTFRKLKINNMHEAVKYALRAGIVDSVEYYISR